MERNVDYPFVLADHPIEIRILRSKSFTAQYDFKDNDGNILGKIFLMDNMGRNIPTLYWIQPCMKSVYPFILQEAVPSLSENILVISRVKGGLTIECNGVMMVHFHGQADEPEDQAKCTAFMEGDVRMIEYKGLTPADLDDEPKEAYRSSGKCAVMFYL